MLQRLLVEEDGQSLVEYGLILGLVSVGLITVMGTLRSNLLNIFMTVGKSLQQASRQGGS